MFVVRKRDLFLNYGELHYLLYWERRIYIKLSNIHNVTHCLCEYFNLPELILFKILCL